jgi:hypothetical protein
MQPTMSPEVAALVEDLLHQGDELFVGSFAGDRVLRVDLRD